MAPDQLLDPQGREAASRAAEHAQAAAASAGLAAAAAAEALGVVAHAAAERGRSALDSATDALGGVARQSADRLPVPVVLEGVVEEAFGRGAEAWQALRGEPRRPVRRWPWATGTAVAGAVLGVAAAMVYQRLAWRDAPGAQEPEELVAVVDHGSTPAAARVDEDGEAVQYS